MTKKDYVLLSEHIKRCADHFFDVRYMASFVGLLAVELLRDNPRFDVVKFERACRPSWLDGSSKEADWEKAFDEPIRGKR